MFDLGLDRLTNCLGVLISHLLRFKTAALPFDQPGCEFDGLRVRTGRDAFKIVRRLAQLVGIAEDVERQIRDRVS